MPKVSVIMNCYNGEQYLREAINSVYAQTYKDWEIVLWDDESTDNTRDIALSYDDRLKYFRGKKATSLGQARNWALNRATGEYIAFLDQDDIWLPHKLEKQICVLDDTNDIDFVYSNYFVRKNEKEWLNFTKRQPTGYVFERFLYFYPVGILTVLMRRNILNRLELYFDENLDICEEFDLFMHILYKSKVMYIEEPLSIYRIHQNMSSIRIIDKYYNEWNYSIEKLKRSYPHLETEYCSAIKYFYVNIACYQGKILIFANKRKLAREYLDQYKFICFKVFIYYLLTFFPTRILNFLIGIKDKFRPETLLAKP
jgi:glycosyltransferase involved in cell wall biosynthesis